MDGVSNNMAARPNYNATKKGAVGGAVAGAASVGVTYGLINASFMPLMADKSVGTKRNLIGTVQSMYEKMGLDMSKTTVSKFIKSTAKSVLKPKNVIKSVAALAVVGAAVGLAVDMVKNHKAKKAGNSVKA